MWLFAPVSPERPVHRHVELEFNMVLQGSAAYLVADRRYELGSGSMVWLFPEQEHILINDSPDFSMWTAVFKPNLLRHACRSAESAPLLEPCPAGRFCAQLSVRSVAGLKMLCEDVARVKEDIDLFNSGLAYLLLAAWAAFRHPEHFAEGVGIHPAVEQAARILSEEAESCSISVLARRVGLSASRLSTLFPEQIGLSLADFRNKQRLERFLALYDGGFEGTLMRAALEAGFGSYPQFHRVFKELTGYSPAEYRRRLRQGSR